MTLLRRSLCLVTLLSIPLLLVSCGDRAAPADTGDASGATFSAPAPARLHQVIEAESIAMVVAPMAVAEEVNASGGSCIKIPAGLAKDAEHTGKLETSFDVPKATKVYFWYRVLWSGTCSNSVSVQVGGSPQFIVGEDGTYKAWHWVKSPPLDLEAGSAKLVIGQREEDIAIDQILITEDADFVPVDIEI